MPCFSLRSKLLRDEIGYAMEGVLREGWLTKSPPEKKMQPGRIFPSKWRKRFFVLHVPPASSSLPGSCGLLEYYDNQRLTKKKGSIDLDQCEEIIQSLDTYHYKYLFALRSKHRGRNRTYYLAADVEDDMNRWVECLRKVCGLKPDPSEVDDEWPVQPAPSLASPVVSHQAPRYTDVDTRESDTPVVTDFVRRPSQTESYTALSECYSDEGRSIAGSRKDRSRASGNHTHCPKHASNTAQGTPPLNRVPPAPRKQRDSVDSIPEMPPPPPPHKTHQPRNETLHDVSRTYDSPRPYVNIENLAEDDGTYKVLKSRPHMDSTYQVPPSHGKPPQSQDLLYSVPPVAQPVMRDNRHSSKRDSNSSNGSRGSNKHDSAYSSEETYDHAPPPRRYSGELDQMDKLSRDLHSSTLQGRSGVSKTTVPRKAQSENSLLESVPPAPACTTGATPYINLPPNSKAHPGYPTPGGQRHVNHANASVPAPAMTDSTYDVPTRRPSEAEILGLSPPPPAHALPIKPKKHEYVNTPSSSVSSTTSMLVPPPGGYAQQQDSYMPMGQQNVPLQTGDRNQQESYLPMERAGGAGSTYLPMQNDSDLYLPMRPGTDVYMPMRPGSDVYLPMGQQQDENYMPMQQSYDENYMPMGSGDRASSSSVYTCMNDDTGIYQSPPSNKPVLAYPVRTAQPPRLTPASTPTPTPVQPGEPYFIFGAQRTRSFKREIGVPSPAFADPPLPRKRLTASIGEVSSSDDDDDDSNPTTPEPSSDSLPSHKPTPMEVLQSKKSLNSTPPPPNRPGEVQYLDLALENNSDSERSPVFRRSPPPPTNRHGKASPTEYKEIDFVKTKALTDMKKDVESKRKSSEKSVDE